MLFAIGGAMDCKGDMQILRRMLHQTGLATPRICLITTATSLPGQAKRHYADALAQLGVHHMTAFHPLTVNEANDRNIVGAIRAADIVLMTGGDQAKLARALNGSDALEAMRDNLREGKIIAGTSAGAAAMASAMIYPRGKSDTGTKKGLSLAPHLILDTHFSERGRLQRLFNLSARRPTRTLLGIDEDTAAIIKPDNTIEAIGKGTITIIGDAITVLKPGETHKLKKRVSLHRRYRG